LTIEAMNSDLDVLLDSQCGVATSGQILKS
jgi:hypothetical protein